MSAVNLSPAGAENTVLRWVFTGLIGVAGLAAFVAPPIYLAVLWSEAAGRSTELMFERTRQVIPPFFDGTAGQANWMDGVGWFWLGATLLVGTVLLGLYALWLFRRPEGERAGGDAGREANSWVLVAVLGGGLLFGVFGLLAALAYVLFQRGVERRLTAVTVAPLGFLGAYALGVLAWMIVSPMQVQTSSLYRPGATEALWWVFASLGLAGAGFYLVCMYVSDSRGVGAVWSVVLGLLRGAVFVSVGALFMIPSLRGYKETFTRAKTLVLFDASNSMANTKDGVPTATVEFAKLPTRQEEVINFLTGDKGDFLGRMQDNNPTDVYRFARALDDDFLHFEDGRIWTRAALKAYADQGKPPELTPPEEHAAPELLRVWLEPEKAAAAKAAAERAAAEKDPAAKAAAERAAEMVKTPGGWSDFQKKRFDKVLEADEDRLKKDGRFFNNTNVPDSMLALVEPREGAAGAEESDPGARNVLALVVFTDGRSTESSLRGYDALADRARKEHIPIFVVAVGAERQKVSLDVTDVRLPKSVQPDDKFRVVMTLKGEGLAGKVVKPVMTLAHVSTDPAKKNANGEPMQMPIYVQPAPPDSNDPAEQKALRDRMKDLHVSLGSSITLKPAEAVKFDQGNPPRAEVEFELDAAALAAQANHPLPDLPKGSKRWEFAETEPGSEFRFTASVPRDPQESFETDTHVRPGPYGMTVLKKPLRVLLMASAATHEYQFVRSMMVREQDKARVKLTVYLQLPPGQNVMREGVVQDATLLKSFPTMLDQKLPNKEEEDYVLNNYDVIVGFDPDWRQLTDDQIGNLKKWADNGGGLILVGGPINTLELARPAGAAAAVDKLNDIRKLYPVVLDDIRAPTNPEAINRDTNDPWPLHFTAQATPDYEFLKLAEDLREVAKRKEDIHKFVPQPEVAADEQLWDEGKPIPVPFLADWDSFFGTEFSGDKDPDAVQHGFFNFYPVVKEQGGGQVLARFGDARAKLTDGKEMPYLVVSSPSDARRRVVWVGWGEIYRLRQVHEAWHERFWTKLTRFAGSLNEGKVVKRITPNIPTSVKEGEQMVIEARIDDANGNRLDPKAKPEVTIHPPGDAADLTPKMKEDVEKKKFLTYKPGSDGWFALRWKPPAPGKYTVDLFVEETRESYPTQSFTVEAADPEKDNTRPDFDHMYQMAGYADEAALATLRKHFPKDEDYDNALKRLRRPKLEGDQTTDDRPKLFFDLSNAELIPLFIASPPPNQSKAYEDPRPVADTTAPFYWLPPWLAIVLAALLAAGCVVGFVLFRGDRPGMPSQYQGAAAAGVTFLIGYYLGRHAGWAAWGVLAAALAVLLTPMISNLVFNNWADQGWYMSTNIQVAWYVLGMVVGLLSLEWLTRKLLRLA